MLTFLDSILSVPKSCNETDNKPKIDGKSLGLCARARNLPGQELRKPGKKCVDALSIMF